MLARSAGGPDTWHNLHLVHRYCNRFKNVSSLAAARAAIQAQLTLFSPPPVAVQAQLTLFSSLQVDRAVATPHRHEYLPDLVA